MEEKDTILYVLKKSEEFLKSKNIPGARVDAEVLLSDVLQLERIKLYARFDQKLTETQKDNYRQKIKERGTNKPVSYIINKKYFYKSAFYVDESVLIPRPETEELVELVLKENNKDKNFSVLDLCSGSGCIGISLKLESPNWNLTLGDIDKKAIDVSKKNAELILKENSTQLNFITTDLYLNIPIESKYDIIVCNPPYIPIEEKPNIMIDVLNFEPHLALFLDNPNEFYNKLLSDSKNHLNAYAKMYIETDHFWAEKIVTLSKELGFSNAIIKKDTSNKNRFVLLDN